MLLKNKTAVVTGANKGIGLEILKSFSANGSKKIFACIRELNSENIKKFESIQKEFNNQIIPIKIDFSKTELIKEAYNNILSHESPIDILVNNAGAISTSLTQMTTMKNYQDIFQINVFGQIQFTQSITKKMSQNGGSIVFISSTSATDAVIGRSAYSSSKNAINTIALTLSRELGKKNIRVNVIAPGLTNTDMMKNNTKPEIIDTVKSQSSLNRVADPLEISKSVTPISSDLFSFMTGQIIRIDGGM